MSQLRRQKERVTRPKTASCQPSLCGGISERTACCYVRSDERHSAGNTGRHGERDNVLLNNSLPWCYGQWPRPL